MDLIIHARRLSGDQPGWRANKLIQGDVPDRIKRVSAQDKTKASLAAIKPDFSDELVTLVITHDPVDTSMVSSSAQAVNQIEGNKVINLFNQIETKKTLTK